MQKMTPRLRDDALLKRSVDAFQQGSFGDALLWAEYVCRRHPERSIPATLRAAILSACRPELAANSWYRAWYCDPENPMLQDTMLTAWLGSGALETVLELGPTFLPARCKTGQHSGLVKLLRQAGMTSVGACWKSGNAIEGMLFGPAANTTQPPSQRMSLLVSNDTHCHQFEVPSDGSRFRLGATPWHGAWSVSIQPAQIAGSAMATASVAIQGSPLVFENTMPSNKSLGIMPVDAPMRTAPDSSASVSDPRPAVDLIIPVYRDHARVQACIASVLSSLPHNKTLAHLIVINDASPEPEMSGWLASLSGHANVTLLHNPHNLGFIETTNRGLRLNPLHDALLLNADTLVHGDWIDRLAAALYSAPDVASVMPWSNNGEIGSFPAMATAAPTPTPTELSQIDQMAAQLHQGGQTHDVEIPSCCGFAMMLRRSVIDQIGLLDGVGLTRGYLEEVDWCMRASAIGYRHLMATAVFVAHKGTVSFRFEKRLRVRQNRTVVIARYPHYFQDYHQFTESDPLAYARQALQAGLEQAGSDWLPKALHFTQRRAEFARALPAALPASCSRVAVWQHRLSATSAGKVLALARIIASRHMPCARGAPVLRLLIIGEAGEALWHTGVVDVLPASKSQDAPLLSDTTLVGLSGCTAVLTEHADTAPIGIAHVQLNDTFEPHAWFATWLQSHSTATSS